MFEGLAFQVLHHDEGLAFMLVNVVNGANVGMVQGGGSTRFPLEAFKGYRYSLLVPPSQHLLGQELEGYDRAEAEILGFVHHAHAAATQLLKDPIMRNDFA